MDQDYRAYLTGQIGNDGQPISTHKCAQTVTVRMHGWSVWSLPCGAPAVTAIRTAHALEPRCQAHTTDDDAR